VLALPACIGAKALATAKKEKSTAKTFIVDAVDDVDTAINHTENDGNASEGSTRKQDKKRDVFTACRLQFRGVFLEEMESL
jgi:hypothetical protein